MIEGEKTESKRRVFFLFSFFFLFDPNGFEAAVRALTGLSGLLGVAVRQHTHMVLVPFRGVCHRLQRQSAVVVADHVEVGPLCGAERGLKCLFDVELAVRK
jgi:hypothetical protein